MTGVVDAPDRHSAGVRLAGVLAELGISTLTLNGQALATRTTDLPGVLEASADGSEVLVGDRLRTHITGASLEWASDDDAFAAALGAISR